MINKAILVGHLGQDPEVKYLADGTAIANFSVATSEKWKDSKGERRERTEWHRVVVWSGLAENCGRYLSKGRQVYVEGKIQTRSYEKDGITRYATQIVAHTVQFLGGNASGDLPHRRQQGYDERKYDDGFQGTSGPPEDDIPF